MSSTPSGHATAERPVVVRSVGNLDQLQVRALTQHRSTCAGLVLGACRSLGRAQDDQHRGFLELVHEEGWWEVSASRPDAPHAASSTLRRCLPCAPSQRPPARPADAWMGVLRDWQDDALAKLTYRRAGCRCFRQSTNSVGHRHGWVRPARHGILTCGAALWCVCNRHQTLFQRITAPSPLLWRPQVTNCHQFSSGATFAKYTNSIVSLTYTHFLMSV